MATIEQLRVPPIEPSQVVDGYWRMSSAAKNLNGDVRLALLQEWGSTAMLRTIFIMHAQRLGKRFTANEDLFLLGALTGYHSMKGTDARLPEFNGSHFAPFTRRIDTVAMRASATDISDYRELVEVASVLHYESLAPGLLEATEEVAESRNPIDLEAFRIGGLSVPIALATASAIPLK